ncbi:MAG: hypothetical protein ABIJ75_10635 [Actinomycetota bacterium]
MTPLEVLTCVVAGILLIGLGIWFYGPDGPARNYDEPVCKHCLHERARHPDGWCLDPDSGKMMRQRFSPTCTPIDTKGTRMR